MRPAEKNSEPNENQQCNALACSVLAILLLGCHVRSAPACRPWPGRLSAQQWPQPKSLQRARCLRVLEKMFLLSVTTTQMLLQELPSVFFNMTRGNLNRYTKRPLQDSAIIFPLLGWWNLHFMEDPQIFPLEKCHVLYFVVVPESLNDKI